MRLAASVLLLSLSLSLCALAQTENQTPKAPPTLKSVLLEQLRTTHNTKDWFVDGNTAIAGLTPEQANWTDGKGNHSIGQLTYHLVFWNRQNLARLKGEKPAAFSGNNDETFTKFDSKTWNDTVQQLDQVMNDLEKWVETADEAKLQESAQVFTHISTHNAYHIGQIILVRKEQGVWDPKNGVN